MNWVTNTDLLILLYVIRSLWMPRTLSSTACFLLYLVEVPHKLVSFSLCDYSFFIGSYLLIVMHNHKLVAFLSIRRYYGFHGFREKI